MRRCLALLPFLVVSGCGNGGDAIAPRPVLTFEMKTQEMTYEDCVAGSAGCTYIRLDYPAIVDAPVGTAVDTITREIHSFLEAPLHPDEPPTRVSALMARFLADFAAFKASQPKAASVESWYLERKAFVLRSVPSLLTLSFAERSYLGGAHGLATVHYVNLDPSTGARKALAEILKEGGLPEATALGEARFREVRGIAEGTTLKDAGFTFENDAFALSNDFALRDDGIAFYYNPYDVAPYAMGPTEIVLKTDEIRGLLRPELAPQSETTAAPQREQ